MLGPVSWLNVSYAGAGAGAGAALLARVSEGAVRLLEGWLGSAPLDTLRAVIVFSLLHSRQLPSAGRTLLFDLEVRGPDMESFPSKCLRKSFLLKLLYSPNQVCVSCVALS